MIHATATTKLDHDNPWPGLESYEEDAQYFFFGRERKIEELLNKVLDAPVTVLFGRSGLGKTSLLRAGLFPILRENDLLPIYVRFEIGLNAAPLTQQLHDSVRESIQQAELPDAMLPSDGESLWEYLHRTDFELWSERNYPLTPVIVLDQFEELFTLGEKFPDRVDAFRNHLGDLAENRIPASLAARIKSGEVVAGQYNLRSRNYKLLISLREDYLPHLDEWRRLIPALGRSRMRLLPLRQSEALDAVCKPAGDLMTDALARRVVEIIAGADVHPTHNTESTDVDHPNGERKDSDVDPALLSLFCRELNEIRKRNGQTHFDRQLIEDNKDTTLTNYYSSCVRGLDASVAEFIEKELISEKGFRNFYPLEDAVPLRLTEEDLAHLVDSRLLRVVDHYGAQRIVLTHDVLTRVVREHRDRRRAEQDRRRAEALEQAAAQREAELDRERRAGRRFRKLTVALAIVCVAAVVLAVVAVINWRSATAARNEADAHFRSATGQRLYEAARKMLAGQNRGGGDDVLGMHTLLAAYSIPSSVMGRKDDLITVLHEQRDLLKIIDLPAAVVMSVAFSPDGTRIASSADSTVRVWNVDGQPVGQPLRHDEPVMSVAFSPDGARIVSGSVDSTVRVWNVDGQPVGQPMRHDDRVMSVAFSPDGASIVSGSVDRTVRVWNVDGQPVGQPMRHDEPVMSVAFSPDGARIASSSYDNTIRLWDATATDREPGVLRGHEYPVRALAFTPDSKHLASAGGYDGTVRLWDATSWQPMLGHGDAAWAGFFEDGRRIGSGSGGNDKTARWWDAATGRPIGEPLRVEDPDVEYLFPVDENRLLSLSYGTADTAQLWDARNRQPIGEPLHLPPEPDRVLVADDTTNPRIAAQLEPGVVQLYRTDTMRPVGESIRTAEEVAVIEFSSDGQIVATGGISGTVELWDSGSGVRIGQPMRGDAYVTSIAFSHDGHLLAAGYNDYTLRLWDTGTFEPIGDPIVSDPVVAQAVAVSPDGRTVAWSGGSDGAIQLWDVGDQSSLGPPLAGHTEEVWSLDFSPDGTKLLSASKDNTLRVWPVLRPDSKLLCAKLTHNLTRELWNSVAPGIDYERVCDLPESEYAG